jgi:glycosyltransferase involved in cell wall biosynthesis
MKLLIWTNIPNHYQTHFFEALREMGVDLKVCYYERVHRQRVAMGWTDVQEPPQGEQFIVQELPAALEQVADWRERIHVVPGFGNRFLRRLVLALCRSGVRWVHWSEPARPGLRWFLGYPLKRAYAELVNRFALGALAISSFAAEDFARWGIQKERIGLLPYSSRAIAGPKQEADPLLAKFRGHRHAFLYMGSLCHRKGIDVLLRAYSKVSHGTDWCLLLVGDDRSGGKYRELATKLGIANRTFFRGPVAVQQLSGVLASAEVLILPSRFDGWGVTLNEAAAQGLALVASDRCGAARHLIEPGRNGFVVTAGNSASLKRALEAYAVDPVLAREHGLVSKEILERYSPEENAKRLLQGIASWAALRSARLPRRH